MDLYKKTLSNLKDTQAREPSQNEMVELATKMCQIAQEYGMVIQTCAEAIELESVGVKHGKCIDSVLIEDLLGVKLVVGKDPNQRKECGCVQSIDIGEYNTCAHGCKYCYANFKDSMVMRNRAAHDPMSPLLVGHLGADDKVSERKLFSFMKIPEPFKADDIVKLKHPELYKKASDFYGYGTNLYKIVEIRGNVVRLAGVQTEVSLAQLKPVAIDGVEDRWIYYDPVIAASIVFPGDEIPAHRTDYSYYMDAFEHCFDERHKSFRVLVAKEKLVYVHEVQHWLRKHHQEDRLKINESML